MNNNKKDHMHPKTKDLQQALRLTGLQTSEAACDIFIRVYEKFSEVGYDYSLKDAAHIIADIRKDHPRGTSMIQTEI